MTQCARRRHSFEIDFLVWLHAFLPGWLVSTVDRELGCIRLSVGLNSSVEKQVSSWTTSGQELKLRRWLSGFGCRTTGCGLNLAFAGCILQLLGTAIQSVQTKAALSCYVTCIRTVAVGDQQPLRRYASLSQQSVPSDSARVTKILCATGRDESNWMRGIYCDELMPKNQPRVSIHARRPDSEALDRPCTRNESSSMDPSHGSESISLVRSSRQTLITAKLEEVVVPSL